MTDSSTRTQATIVRRRIAVKGIVQGVGFRPTVYRLAHVHGLAGWVLNDSAGVKIEVEGDAKEIDGFIEDLKTNPPPLSQITGLSAEDIPVQGEDEFVIKPSDDTERRSGLISPDVATCEDCRREMFNRRDRRYRYPFINCTNCGPRYTIIRTIPYDRPKTTMAHFEMCSRCSREYHDPANRRFHAQPNACPDCGPSLTLLNASGGLVRTKDPVGEAALLLHSGKVVAVKGIGGFHLAADAANEGAVRRLRERKRREEKPFAVMSRSPDKIREYAVISDEEEELLSSWQRPIVLLRKTKRHAIAPSVAPRSKFFGVMLPYSPVHHLLLAEDVLALVMTSGNPADEPITADNTEALKRLEGIADAFLVHDRDICVRTDDSVARVQRGTRLLMRRARGYVPAPIALKDGGPIVLGVGAELRNTVCIARGDEAFLSQHIGDVKKFHTLRYLEKIVEHMKKILEVEPEAIAHDLHPDYFSTRYARERAGVKLIGIQHHHAHIASCLAEHRLDKDVIGLSFDGLGYGTDGRIWGGEFLVADTANFRRIGHFKYVRMPGGDVAVEKPPRMALSLLLDAFDGDLKAAGIPMLDQFKKTDLKLLVTILQGGINTPKTSSLGRLFDAVSAMLGVCNEASYEGQPAIELEGIADEVCTESYDFMISPNGSALQVDMAPAIRQIVRDIRDGVDRAAIAGRFHNTIVNVSLEMCLRIREKYSLDTVAFSGGVFQNLLLAERLASELTRSGFEVLQHHHVPPNDGGLSLGQAVIARTRM
ncbi:MAG: carbamoyltransferase HypF [Planctomycetes bacterium]|nr:carbamoyltransferase HypF [Planctomycetota bacterium]